MEPVAVGRGVADRGRDRALLARGTVGVGETLGSVDGVDRLPVDRRAHRRVAPDGHRGRGRHLGLGRELGQAVAGRNVQAIGDEVLAAARHVVVAGELGAAGDRLAGSDGDVVRRRRGRALDQDAEVVDRLAVPGHFEQVGVEARAGDLPARQDHRPGAVVGDRDHGDDVVAGAEPGAIDFERGPKTCGGGRTGGGEGKHEQASRRLLRIVGFLRRVIGRSRCMRACSGQHPRNPEAVPTLNGGFFADSAREVKPSLASKAGGLRGCSRRTAIRRAATRRRGSSGARSRARRRAVIAPDRSPAQRWARAAVAKTSDSSGASSAARARSWTAGAQSPVWTR